MNHRLFLLLPLCLLCSLCQTQAQEAQWVISGFIEDASSGEQLLGATVWHAASATGTTANLYGHYSISLPAGKQEVLFSYLGYTPQKLQLELSGDLKLDIALVSGLQLGEAVVEGGISERIEERVQMSRIDVPVDQIKRLPAVAGEVDLLKTLQLLPGVQSGSEGSSGIYVRGGSPDQNLIMLDGVPLYSVSHLFGFFSVFNADAVRNVSIMKGGYPARYGGRLSSIIEVTMKEGHKKEIHGAGSISMLASKLTLEGPIAKDKASFMISGRRTYLDVLLNPIIQSTAVEGTEVDPAYFFHDLNAKVNWRLGDKDRLYLSTFQGLDDFGLRTKSTFNTSSEEFDLGLDWRNSVLALRWNHEWGANLFSNLTVMKSRYDFNTGFDFRGTEQEGDSIVSNRFASLYNSGIRDLGGRIDFDFTPNNRHFVRFGGNLTRHRFQPGATQAILDFGQEFSLDTTIGSPDLFSTEAFVYLEDEIDLNEDLTVNIGAHTSTLFVEGVNYISLQPRLALNKRLPGGMALKASYAEMTQFVNLLTNEGLTLPTDLWLPSTARIRPQQSWQAALGAAKSLGEIEVSIEGYYKEMDGLLGYKEGASFGSAAFGFEGGTSWEDQVTQGEGRSYGAELLLQKKQGRTSGWIGYTLSWTDRQFDDVNSGQRFPFTYDRRHDVSVVLVHELSDKWTLSGTWVYGTGRALTLNEVTYGSVIPNYQGGLSPIDLNIPSNRNAYRMSPYHRLDLSATRTKIKEHGERSLVLSVYNAYNNLNPFLALPGTLNDGTPIIREYGLFPFIPSVAWQFSF
ncbi:MAG: TonB-dependent receptor [Flavobacteriales bacterium]|nr:TonB-dependent receptor [Flavobacteriales bacterium]